MIKSLKITCFRGIPRDLEINFVANRGLLSSILLLGDNGTGKSSVADAFEFCLRGKVSRRGNAGAKIRYESRNLLVGGNPSIQSTLDDERQFVRGAISRSFAGVRLRRDDFAPGFSLSPVVLSRADIDVFWQVTAADRMRFFFDYLRDSVQHSGYAALEIERYQASLESTRVRVLESQIAVAAAIGCPVAEIPVDDRASFYTWRGRMYPQYGTEPTPFRGSDRARMRAINQIPAHIRMALSELGNQLESVHRLRAQLEGRRQE